ncbi:hypothetical protein ACWDSJ_33100 [Nocardia sp. NPDC003482]
MQRLGNVVPRMMAVGSLTALVLGGGMAGVGVANARPDAELSVGKVEVSEDSAKVEVKYSCSKDDKVVYLAAGVLQANPSPDEASGEKVQEAECDGKTKMVTVEVAAGQGKFDKSKPALVAAGLLDEKGESVKAATTHYKPE